MGNSITAEQLTNFKTLLTACRKKNIDEIRIIIENNKDFNFYYKDLTFFHYLVIEAIDYEKDKLQKLCDLIYEYRGKFGDCTKKPKYEKYIQLIYHEKEKKYTTRWTDDNCETIMEIRNNIHAGYQYQYRLYHSKHINHLHNLNDLDPMSFCLKIKTDFLAKNGLQDNLNIVIDLLNKITNKNNVGPEICIVCKKNKKNILVRNCNHVCICRECLTKSTICPVCKKDIVSSEEIIL